MRALLYQISLLDILLQYIFSLFKSLYNVSKTRSSLFGICHSDYKNITKKIELIYDFFSQQLSNLALLLGKRYNPALFLKKLLMLQCQ